LTETPGGYNARVVIMHPESREELEVTGTIFEDMLDELAYQIQKYLEERESAFLLKEQESTENELPEFSVSKDIGFLQWLVDKGVDFKPQMLSSVLQQQAGHEVTFYENNTRLQQAVIEGRLPREHKKVLFDRLGREVFITGKLNETPTGYRSLAVVLTPEDRKEIEATGPTHKDMLDTLAVKIQRYMNKTHTSTMTAAEKL
jgi:hypothetical protein